MGNSSSSAIQAPSANGRHTERYHPTNFYRRVIDTTDVSQLVEMNLRGGVRLKGEVQHLSDQTLIIRTGSGVALVRAPMHLAQTERIELYPGGILRIQKGWWHEIKADPDGMSLVTVYSPPVHHAQAAQLEQPP